MVRDNPELNKRIADMTALGRTGLPDDIGPMIASLLSEDNRWINAQFRAACRSSREDAADGASPVACPAIHYNRGPVQKGLAFRSTSSIGVVVRRGANGARMTQPPPSALADPGLVLVRGSDRPGFQDVRKVGS